ncbi:ParB N-terminal domain-containing protein [Ancylobacter sp. IITR112]|uniref:ParB N-terminal domain-containing protein n=1 Tax=Ancylobacter sp. IITR112 TaxID=3138073 RepID=UPI003529F38F
MRAIDPAPYQKAFWADFAGADRSLGAAPMLQWIEIRQLRVDPSYQRDITAEGQRSLFAIARAFDWRKFAPVVVAPIEGGLYAIIDGQHRTTAAALRKIESVPCEVVIADQAEQASAFAAINGQVTRLHSMAIFHARVKAGEKEAVLCDEVCRAAGVTVLRYPVMASRMERGQTIAPNVIMSAIARHGRDVVQVALSCVTQTGEGNPGMLGKPVIEALCTVLAATPEWRKASGDLLDAMDDFNFQTELTEARVAHHRGGGPLNGELSSRITHFLQQRLPLPTQAAE